MFLAILKWLGIAILILGLVSGGLISWILKEEERLFKQIKYTKVSKDEEEFRKVFPNFRSEDKF